MVADGEMKEQARVVELRVSVVFAETRWLQARDNLTDFVLFLHKTNKSVTVCIVAITDS